MAIINRLNCKIGGPAGTGVMTMGALFAKCLQRAGLEVVGTNDYPSLIKGGHNTYKIRAAPEPISAIVGKYDLLLALDRLTVELHWEELVEGGAVIYDSDHVKEPSSLIGRSDIVLIGAPLTQMASAAGGEIMFNTVALGAAMGLMHLDFAILEKLLKSIWARKGSKVVDANIAAAQAGYDFVKEKNGAFRVQIEEIKGKKPKMFINGNEACVLGAVKAGCKFVAEYPMSPSTSILHLMAGHEREYGIVVKQTEDEIAAANMIAGAGAAGVRAMTATSGGGFSLMVEALGLMGIAEIPAVIFESQRAGPSTGLPTYTEQADLLFALHASQGEFPRVVVAPGDPLECYLEAINAFNIAELVQTPVIVLLDKFLSETSLTIEDVRSIPVKIERGKLMTDEQMESATGFKRYAFSEDGISPRCIFGQKNSIHVASSYEHDETGFTSEDPKMRVAMINKRARKLSAIPDYIIAPSFAGAGEDSAEILLVCWGSTKMPMLEALKLLGQQGIAARMMHIRYASPFPARAVLSALTSAMHSHGKTVIFEGNSTAQMRSLIFQKTGYYIENAYLRYDARPFKAEEIAQAARKHLGR
ncbi:MAG: 2-oxoacid:acceptor oxidoreductase subunit alpha [Candidatus Micrarchaeota archaeon]|nr:2-oxoacid:acceptor oxidoreductase subunit alpha [Candidatus Micrarchaeota archaeon]